MRIPVLIALFAFCVSAAQADPLPSWTDGEAKNRILTFVETVTDPDNEEFVPVADRIAVFDNDGTLWSEQPVYFQFLYALDKLKQMAEADPSVLTSDVLKAAAAGDLEVVAKAGHDGLIEIVMISHAGLTVQDFQADVAKWISDARHPTKDMPLLGMTYQPMLELLRYLRDEGFTTYIVSGGGIHFMRAFAEDTYGIPPENIIGSAGNGSYQVVGGKPVLMKDPGIAFIDDKEGKPLGIDAKIGKRPILAGGNSDGDFQMLEWVTSGDGPRFGLLVHHTDADREWAYDRESSIGKLVKGLDEADDRGWLLVDMQKDWRRVWSGASNQ